MAKEKGFLKPVALGMLAGAALSAAAVSMSDSRARRAVRRQASRAAGAVSSVADELGQVLGK